MKNSIYGLLILSAAWGLSSCASSSPVAHDLPPAASASPSVPMVAPPVPVTPERHAYLANKKVSERARLASNAPTFDGAVAMLKAINDNDISDPDLASYVAISRQIAGFCADLGIPRDASLTYTDIILKLDYPAILSRLVAKGGVVDAAAEATRLVGVALKIRQQIRVYLKLDTALSERYSAD